MVLTQIQLEDEVYERVKLRALSEKRSTESVICEAVDRYVAEPSTRKLTLADFTFIGSGQSDGIGPHPLSERHDEALAATHDE